MTDQYRCCTCHKLVFGDSVRAHMESEHESTIAVRESRSGGMSDAEIREQWFDRIRSSPSDVALSYVDDCNDEQFAALLDKIARRARSRRGWR